MRYLGVIIGPGYKHSAYTFSMESAIKDSKFNYHSLPSSLLMTFLEKALILMQMESHIGEVISAL